MGNKTPVEDGSSERSNPMHEIFSNFFSPPSRILENKLIREVMGADLIEAAEKTFEQIEVAGGMLDDATARHPECAALRDVKMETFKWWMPRIIPKSVYRNHVQELLDRIIKGQALPPATLAEMLTFLGELGSRNVLQGRFEAVFGWLMVEVTGLRYPAILQMSELQTESERNKTLAELREELKSKWRRLRPGDKLEANSR